MMHYSGTNVSFIYQQESLLLILLLIIKNQNYLEKKTLFL